MLRLNCGVGGGQCTIIMFPLTLRFPHPHAQYINTSVLRTCLYSNLPRTPSHAPLTVVEGATVEETAVMQHLLAAAVSPMIAADPGVRAACCA
jgi:hypothetical protein